MSRVFGFFFSPATQFARYLFVGRAMLFTLAEIAIPARDVPYRSLAITDLFIWGAELYLIAPIASGLSLFFPGYHFFPTSIMALPFPVRLAVGLVLGDLGGYGIHRLMHTRYFWSAHKWHHAPTHMYWLAGVRTTAPQQFLANIPYTLVMPLYLVGSSRWVALPIG